MCTEAAQCGRDPLTSSHLFARRISGWCWCFTTVILRLFGTTNGPQAFKIKPGQQCFPTRLPILPDRRRWRGSSGWPFLRAFDLLSSWLFPDVHFALTFSSQHPLSHRLSFPSCPVIQSFLSRYPRSLGHPPDDHQHHHHHHVIHQKSSLVAASSVRRPGARRAPALELCYLLLPQWPRRRSRRALQRGE